MKIQKPIDIAINHGLTKSEYRKIVKSLEREPNLTEIGILGAMWSEHCSYKSSKIYLKTLPTTGDHIVQGPGENAGIIDLGDDYCAAFKMESHNHPSFIEPYQGAATGVGGILRDIFTMGARPIALLDSLRFGNPKLSKTKYLVKGVVSGIAGYGNCMGIPTVGGEVYFDDCYNGNPLVNVFCLGIVKKNKIFRGYASGIGNPVIYVGSKTGRDGIQGAIMASDTFTKEAEEKRPAVQVGDPFTEKLLLEACLELFKTDIVVGIQDMGAAGLTSSSTEMAERAATGLEICLDKVPRREENMTPYEIMLSESQERMLIVLKKGKERRAEKIFKKWGLDFCVIGKVTNTQKLTLYENNSIVADLPIDLITEDAPQYKRPTSTPKYLKKLNKKIKLKKQKNLNKVFLKLLSSPTLANKKWIFQQYDYMVRTNTIVEPGSDAAVIKVKGTKKALGLTVNCNSRYCYLDPKNGAKIAVAESARNLACSGAKPLAVTDCLNFGNPENPEIMWQFKEAVKGISSACKALNTPVVGGNVSLYNETEGEAIYPTPSIGMVGIIDDYNKRISQWFKNQGDIIVILGDTLNELGGSEYLNYIEKKVEGNPPKISLKKENNLISTLLDANSECIINSAHDISDGGLLIALAESCFNPENRFGIIVNLDNLYSKKLPIESVLFSETQSRCIVSIDKKDIQKLKNICRNYNVPIKLIGVTAGRKFIIENFIDISIDDAYKAWNNGFEESIS